MKRVAVLLFLAPILACPLASAGPADPPVPADVQTLVQGNTSFALDLYARLCAQEGNLFYSPYSISTALAMTSAGARGATAEQMARVLHFSLDSRRLHPAFAELTRELNGRGLPRDYQLHVAQSLWGERGLPVLADFQSILRTDYGASLRLVDFSGAPDATRLQINDWVEQRTNDRIKDLLHKGDIDPLTRMVLVNAIYFKAAWQHPFNGAVTRKDAIFHVGARQVKAAMMHQTRDFRYAEGEGFQAVELPYEGGELSMVVLLPVKQDSLHSLERSLTAAKLDGWLGKLASRKVAVELPRFKFKTRVELAKELKAMGMSLAFGPEADFSGISTAEKLRISKVIHEAFVGINEAGTEAGAATAAVVGLAAPPETPVPFRADHPFLFLIREQRTGSVLFLGRVTDPS